MAAPPPGADPPPPYAPSPGYPSGEKGPLPMSPHYPPGPAGEGSMPQPGYPHPGFAPQPGYPPPPGYPPQPGYSQPGYPPQPGYAPQPGYPPAPPGPQPATSAAPVTVQVVQGAVVSGPTFFRDAPVRTNCPNCHIAIQSTVEYESGTCTYLACLGLCLVGCDAGCCLIPFCMDSTKDMHHRCPQCGHHLGSSARL